MKFKDIGRQLQHESKVIQGKATRDMTYESSHTYPDVSAAEQAFADSVVKLLHVNRWSHLSFLSADFALYDPSGNPKSGGTAEPGDFIRIDLPGPVPSNWVRVIHREIGETMAEFTVQPCPDPLAGAPDQVAHFFSGQARSTFRLSRADSTISAFEIGQQESINNRQPQAGKRGLINTIIAETGWLFYQKIQWKLLTNYLVHL